VLVDGGSGLAVKPGGRLLASTLTFMFVFWFEFELGVVVVQAADAAIPVHKKTINNLDGINNILVRFKIAVPA
jgi:uncharacterized protein (DUF2062 family)